MSRLARGVQNTPEEPLDIEVVSRLRTVTLLAMDVDGVLTDGKILFSSSGHETKAFHVSDGLGLVLLKFIGVRAAWITGRESEIVTKRARELGIDIVCQNVRDKGACLLELQSDFRISREQIALIADDWNDLTAFPLAGVRIAVNDAQGEVKSRADFVTINRGGEGAVREVVDLMLDARGLRAATLEQYLATLRSGAVTRGSGQ